MLLLTKSVDFTLGSHVLLRVPHAVHALLTRARTQRLTAARKLKYEDALLNSELVTLERSPPLNLASLVPVIDPTEGHDCTAMIEEKPVVRDKLHKVPLQKGLVLFVDGSSLVLSDGQRAAGFSVIQYCAPDKFRVLLAAPLRPPVSSQVAELCAATAALQIAGQQPVTIWTDSMYVFSVAHDYYALWVERDFMTAAGAPIKNAPFIMAMLEALHLPFEVSVVHCRGHKCDDSVVTQGNNFADRMAQAAAHGTAVATEYKKVMYVMPSTVPSPLEGTVADLQSKFLTEDDMAHLTSHPRTFAKDSNGVWLDIASQLPVALATLQWYLIRLLHLPTHIGSRPMAAYLRRGWWCPGVGVKCSDLVARCHTCAEFNPGIPMHMTRAIAPSPSSPFEKIQLDFISLPPVNKMQWALVLIDIWSGWPEVWPTARDDSITVVKILVRDVVPRWGVVSEVSSDRGPHFASEIMASLCKALGIEQRLHCPHHAQSAGKVERLNGTIKAKLGKACEELGINWIQALPSVLYSIRAMPRSGRLGLSPFEVLFGRIMPVTALGPSNARFICNDAVVVKQVEQLTNTMAVLYPRVKATFEDPPVEHLHKINVGDAVYYRNWSRKNALEPRWLGPKRVLLTTHTAVKLEGVKNWTHVSHLKLTKDIGTESLKVPAPSPDPPLDLSPDPEEPRYLLRPRKLN